MVDKLRSLLIVHKITASLIFLLIIIIIGGFFGYQQFLASRSQGSVQEVDLIFNAEGPYAILSPRRDGNALVLNLKRTSSYDSISYELAYTSTNDTTTVTATKSADDGEGGSSGSIDRGVVGEINTHDKKSEYTQEILFGTCSKNVCKYDKGVENGTLTLHIRKGSEAYRMSTQWHIQKPDVALGNLSSGDGHFVYSMPSAKREDLATLGYSIVNDLTGVPKLPDGKVVSGKVYGLNLPDAKALMAGNVRIELASNPPTEAKIYRYSDGTNWQGLDTKVSGSTLTAQASGAGIFAVLVDKK